MIPGAIFTVELHAPTAITSKIRRIEESKRKLALVCCPDAGLRPAFEGELGPRIETPLISRGAWILDPSSPSPREARSGQQISKL
jgi:hypothetical protein